MASEGKPTLHHMDRSQSQRILWLLEELGIEYNLVNHLRVKDRAPPELKETHPLGKSPQLVTSDGRVIAESSAIAKYLIEKYDNEGKFKGDAKNDSIRDEELSSLSGTSFNSNVMIEMLFKAMATRSPFFVRPLITGIHGMLSKAFLGPELKAQLSYLNDQLGGQDYYMGASPGRADFIISWTIDMASQQSIISLNDYPKIKAWNDRCKARDAWKRGIEKGNGYDLRF